MSHAYKLHRTNSANLSYISLREPSAYRLHGRRRPIGLRRIWIVEFVCSLFTARERSQHDSPCLETSHSGLAVTSCPGSQNDCVWASAMDTGSIARIPASSEPSTAP